MNYKYINFSVLKAKRKRLDNLILPFIEKMYFHLIGYAEKNLTATELKQILEEPMQTGETLFSAASYNSLPIANDLIKRNIEINFINDLFMTPQARFYSLSHETCDAL